MSVEKHKLGSIATLLSTELNSLASNSLAIGSAWDNTQGQTGDGYTYCEIELVTGSFGSAPTTGTAIALWFLKAPDGTNYEDGGSSVTPARQPDVVFPLRNATGAHRVVRHCWLPPGLFKPLAKNDATGQALASSGNTVKVRPVTLEAV